MADRNDLPSPSAPNFNQRVRETLMTYLGRQGNGLDQGLTLRDMIDAGIVKFKDGFTGGGGGSGGGGGGGGGVLPIEPIVVVVTPDLTPPPTVTGLTITAGLNTMFVSTNTPSYTQGHGHLRTHLFIAKYTSGALPTFANAVESAQFTGNFYTFPADIGTTIHVWATWESVDGVQGQPGGGTNGASATTGKIGNVDLGPLIVEAGNLAAGSVTQAKVADGALNTAKFAAGIEPVTIVTGSTLPTTKSTSSIFLTGTGKLYRWNGTAYTASVPGTDIEANSITAGQIQAGAISATEIAAGAITTAKLAAGAVTANELAANSITAGKIAANAIAVGTAAIQNGAIVNAMIGDATITSAKIANLAADKITAGSMQVGSYIQSTSYVAGTSGWSINANGTAEFSGVTVRGTVYATAGSIGANTIDSTGMQSTIYTAGSVGWRIDSGGTIKAYSASGTRAFDLGASGTTPVLKVGSALEILGNGSATFTGTLTAANGNFSGTLVGATGEFAGTLRAGVVDLTSSLGQTTTYATPGTYTITVPTGKTSMRVTLVGGGGGGGGGSARGYQHTYQGGGGGGGGGYVTALYSGLTPNTSYTLVVGAGGAAGFPSDGIYSVGGNGAAGGATYVSGVISANGGGGGVSAYYGGTGGASGGTSATAGQQASVAFDGGNGGNSIWGVGGNRGFGDTSVAATTGTGFGSGGGGGGGNSANNLAGMNPAAGLGGKAVIEFFDPNGVVLRTEYSPLLAALVRQNIAIV